MTGRQWKAHKRKQLQAVIRAVDELRCGCVYFPFDGQHLVGNLDSDSQQLKELLSVKNWGR